MNREVLFRGKRVDNNEWVYGSLIVFSLTKDGKTKKYDIKLQDAYNTNLDNYRVIPESISQFTNLTDKNGVKIFEGDRLRDDYSDDDGNVIESSVKVIWDNEKAQWGIDNSFKQDGSSLTNLVYYLGINNLEVVSNG